VDFKKKDEQLENCSSDDIKDLEFTNNPGIIGHLKFNRCVYSETPDVEQLSGKRKLPATVKRISAATKDYMAKLSSNPETVKNVIFKRWDSIVGDIFKNIITPLKINKATLILKSESPAASQDFLFVKNDVLKNINSLFGAETIKYIKIIQ